MFRVGLVFPRTIIPEAGVTFLSLHHDAALTPSVDWGLAGGLGQR